MFFVKKYKKRIHFLEEMVIDRRSICLYNL